MSGNIDRRVVEMRFDNTDFEKNTQDTINILDKLKSTLAFKDAGKDFDTNGLTSAVDKVKDRFSALEIIGVTALVNLTNSAVNLGKQLAKSLTVDQVRAGFSEYELKMGSIQTIMASTGEELKTVNGYLNELNTYADRTIYSFSDMTQNIGKFTNAGVKLEDAVAAIKGISNEAALSGANANEASRAMYNFAQALSAGYVKLIDWKSIENANMATKGFKQQLIDTALAMGKLEKTTDGYKSTTTDLNGKVSEAFTSTKGFNESLAHQWMTTEVLTQTLQNYSVDLENMSEAEKKAWREQMKSVGYSEEQIKSIEKLSKSAYAAAQDVKTFSQLMDTIREAIGSGWAQTFELIFGDLEEAKKLWTAVNEEVSGFISKSADARNGILKTWHDSDNGRKAFFSGLHNLYNAALSILTPINEAFRDLFPPITAKQLINFSMGFEKLTKSMILSDETAESVHNIFRLLFSVIKVGTNAVSGFAKIVMGFVRGFAPAAADGLQVLGSIGELLSRFTEAIADAAGEIGKFTGSVIGSLFSGLTAVFKVLKNDLPSIGDIGALLGGIGLFKAGKQISDFLKTFTKAKDSIKSTTGLVNSIKSVFGALSETLKTFQSTIKVHQLSIISTAILELAFACVILASIPVDKLTNAVGAVSALMVVLNIAARSMRGANAKGLTKMASAVVILALAVKTLSEVENLGQGLLGVGVLMVELLAFFKLFDALKIDTKGIFKLSTCMILVATALTLLSVPIKALGGMDIKSLGKGLLGVGGSLLLFVAFFKLMDNKAMQSSPRSLYKFAASLLIFASALTILAIPIRILGAMDMKSLGKGLLGVVGALGTFIAFAAIMDHMKVSPVRMIALSVALAGMALAIQVIAGAVLLMSSFDSGDGLLTLAAALLELTVAMYAMQGAIPGAAALLVVAAALAIFAPALALLSTIGFKGAAAGLLLIAGAIGLFAGAALLLTPVIPVMLALAGTFALFGLGVIAVGAGLTTLAAAFATGTGAIVKGLSTLSKALPELVKGIVEALLTILDGIAAGADRIEAAFVAIITAILGALEAVLPNLITFGLRMMLSLMQGISENISQIASLAADIVVNFINGIASKSEELVNAGFNMIITFFNGLANAIAVNGPILIDSVKNVILSVLEVVAGEIPIFGDYASKAIEQYRQGLDSGKKGVKTSAEGVSKASKIKGHDQSKEGRKGASTFAQGEASGKKDVRTAAKANEDAANMKVKDQSENGRNAVKGLISGLGSQEDSLRKKAESIASIVDKVIKKKNQIKSPSRVLAKDGKYMMQGLINGLDSMMGDYKKRADNISTVLLTSTDKAISAMGSFNAMNLSGAISQSTDVNLRMADVKRENDKLASGINSLTKRLDSMTESMNSRTLNNYISIEGSSDPEGFADDLIRSFRLNARTV